jgi:hypothetical protein
MFGSKVLMIKASFHATGYGRACGKSKVMDRGICNSETQPCAAASVASWGPQHDQERLHIRISYRNTSSTCCSQSSKQISLAPERNAGTLSKLLEIQCPFHTLPTQRSRCGWQLSRCSWQPQQHPGLGAGRGPLRGGCPEVTSPKTKNNIGSWDSLPRGPAFWRQLRPLDFRNFVVPTAKKGR